MSPSQYWTLATLLEVTYPILHIYPREPIYSYYLVAISMPTTEQCQITATYTGNSRLTLLRVSN